MIISYYGIKSNRLVPGIDLQKWNSIGQQFEMNKMQLQLQALTDEPNAEAALIRAHGKGT